MILGGHFNKKFAKKVEEQKRLQNWHDRITSAGREKLTIEKLIEAAAAQKLK
jgi:hypothetical protein